MAKKKHGLVDRLMHPGQHEEEIEEVQGDETLPAAKKPEPKSRKAGKADPAADYQTHPKFSKFKGRA